MFMNEFPYTNYHNLNLDWITKTVKELNDSMLENFTTALSKYFNSVMPNVVYDEEDEKITLSFELVVDGDTHSYTADDDTLTIE